MGRKKKNPVAKEEDVAAFFSAVMWGKPAADENLPGLKDQLKAAELLAKHFGMFGEKKDEQTEAQMEFFNEENLET